ncbi:MAG: hypothetical protein KGS72_25505 [Cyanobacteria bacterium REEB67]|nr:hypothetical protein [Cyanobacteria bacterium REEB67]
MSKNILAGTFLALSSALIAATLSAFSPQPGAAAGENDPQIFDSKLKIITQPDLDKILSRRLIGRLGADFAPFAKIFFSTSRMDLSCSIGLATNSEEIKKTHLTSPFTPDYRPTLHELLDAIALQTNSRWTYNPSAQAIKTEGQSEQNIGDIAIIEFIPESKPLPVEMTASPNWKVERHNDVINYTCTVAPPAPAPVTPSLFQAASASTLQASQPSPPNGHNTVAPAALHLVVMGQFSSDDKSKEGELLAKAPMTLAVENFKRFKSTAAPRDLQKAKIGPYSGFCFETNTAGKNSSGPVVRREWYFMAGDQLCYIVSTIPKQQDRELYPEVQAMLKSVRAKQTLKI